MSGSALDMEKDIPIKQVLKSAEACIVSGVVIGRQADGGLYVAGSHASHADVPNNDIKDALKLILGMAAVAEKRGRLS